MIGLTRRQVRRMIRREIAKSRRVYVGMDLSTGPSQSVSLLRSVPSVEAILRRVTQAAADCERRQRALEAELCMTPEERARIFSSATRATPNDDAALITSGLTGGPWTLRPGQGSDAWGAILGTSLVFLVRDGGGAFGIIAHEDPLVSLTRLARQGALLRRLGVDRFENTEQSLRFERAGVPVAKVGQGFVSLNSAVGWLRSRAPRLALQVDVAWRVAMGAAVAVEDGYGSLKPAGTPLAVATVMSIAVMLSEGDDVSAV